MKSETELKINQPLLGFFDFCETYCVAGCCGVDAFEISEERVAEWVSKNGIAAAKDAREQLQTMISDISKQDVTVTSDRLNAWWPAEACAAWLDKWVAVLNIVLNKEN